MQAIAQKTPASLDHAAPARTMQGGARPGLMLRAPVVGNQARLRALSRITPRLQAKLEIGAVDDPLEREADQVAGAVLNAKTPAPAALRRKCAACEEEDGTLQREPDGAAADVAGDVPASVRQTLDSAGQRLDADTRAFFEPRFGMDFSGVRVHDDDRAAQSARDVGAHAYAVSNHVVFAAGRFAPKTSEGGRLLAHELAHTVQQRAALPVLQRQEATPADTGKAADTATCLVHFVQGSTEFTDAKEFAACMASIKAYLAADASRTVELSGFASEEGDAQFNTDLAQRRADTVKNLLVAGGVPAARLTATGHGADKTYATLEDNRRVEIPHPVPPPPPPPPPPPTQESPAAKKGICGPVVTKQLGNGMNNLRNTFKSLPEKQRNEQCDEAVDSVQGLVAWDFLRLHVRDWMEHEKCATILSDRKEGCCANSVQVNDQCYYAGSPNYVLFGGMCKLCFDHYVAKSGNNLGDIDNFTSKAMLSMIQLYKSDAANFRPSQAWALAGYKWWPAGGTPPSGDCNKECATSCGPYFIPGAVDNEAFRARWCPHIDPVNACKGKLENVRDIGERAPQ